RAAWIGSCTLSSPGSRRSHVGAGIKARPCGEGNPDFSFGAKKKRARKPASWNACRVRLPAAAVGVAAIPGRIVPPVVAGVAIAPVVPAVLVPVAVTRVVAAVVVAAPIVVAGGGVADRGPGHGPADHIGGVAVAQHGPGDGADAGPDQGVAGAIVVTVAGEGGARRQDQHEGGGGGRQSGNPGHGSAPLLADGALIIGAGPERPRPGRFIRASCGQKRVPAS